MEADGVEISDLELEYLRHLVGGTSPKDFLGNPIMMSSCSEALASSLTDSANGCSSMPYVLYEKLNKAYRTMARYNRRDEWVEKVTSGKTDLSLDEWLRLT